MTVNTALKTTAPTASEIARELGPIFAERATATADEDVYVADNFAMLKASGLVEAGVPAEYAGSMALGLPVDRIF